MAEPPTQAQNVLETALETALDGDQIDGELADSGAAGTPSTGGGDARPIVLGTDFGPTSATAERVAIAAAAAAGVDLLVVNAIDMGRLGVGAGLWGQRIDQVRAARERLAADVVARARAAGVRAHVLIWSGDPATCVVEAANAEGGSRIVVGSHGRGRIGRMIAGSVSTSVAARAPIPVEIVRAEF